MKCLLRRLHSNSSWKDKTLLTHPVSRRNNRVQRPDMKYLEFDLGVGQGINLYFVIPVTKWFTSPRFTYMEV